VNNLDYVQRIAVNTTHSLFKTAPMHQTPVDQIGVIDLTGAEFEYGGRCLHILNGRLGRMNPQTSLANGHLSIITDVKPSLFLSRAQISWRNLEFELMMISIQEFTLQAELKLKFIARWIPSLVTKAPSL
jgi:hypothetical protein